MKCNNCGNSSEYNINYCINCGNQINNKNVNTLNKKRKSNKVFILSLVSIFIGVVAFFIVFKPTKNRTIMIYINGNSIEKDNVYSINDIFPEEFDSKNINVVFIADGSKKFLDFIKDDSVGIYEYKNNKVKLLKSIPNSTLGQSATLGEFLNYSTEKFKSEKYDLIFWNHGVSSLSSETAKIENEILNTLEIKAAFNNSKFNNDNKLEYVNFISSVSANYENALVLSDFANYMVASEEILYESKDFINIYDLINVKVTDNSVDINKKFITNYQNEIAKLIGEYDYSQTHSILDLTKMSSLNRAINDFFSNIDLTDELLFKKLSRVRARVTQYGFNQIDYEYIDIYNFMEKLRDEGVYETISVIDSLDEVIIYNKTNQEKYTSNHSNGLSFYFPYIGNKEYINSQLSIYEKSNVDKYISFIKNFLKIMNDTEINNYTYRSTIAPEVSGLYVMIFDEGLVNNFASASNSIYKKINDNYHLIYSFGDWSLTNHKNFGIPTSVYELEINDKPSNIYLNGLYYSANSHSFAVPAKIYKNETDYISVNIIYNITFYFRDLDKFDIGSIIPVISNSGYLFNLNEYKYIEFEIGAYAAGENDEIDLSNYRIVDKLKYEISQFNPKIVETNGDNYSCSLIVQDVYGHSFEVGIKKLQMVDKIN